VVPNLLLRPTDTVPNLLLLQGVSILALNATTFGEEYKAAQHPLSKYRKDVQQVRTYFTRLALLVLKYFVIEV